MDGECITLISINNGFIPYTHHQKTFFHCLFSNVCSPCINLFVSFRPMPNKFWHVSPPNGIWYWVQIKRLFKYFFKKSSFLQISRYLTEKTANTIVLKIYSNIPEQKATTSWHLRSKERLYHLNTPSQKAIHWQSRRPRKKRPLQSILSALFSPLV